ncbi:pyridoxal phosphate-dependent aminotransferase [Haladaptatus sp. GCM10025707]|uniref:pyridoxal phosphate-dependent aminotransferase n=1 Tax=unclassified Haladaptatus TaxID=2622732 RepID=UPI0023E8D9AA|nr:MULTISPECIES: pyridoxal phosphate-dependent aminotransferase [unclassified Haladaptatus]
MFPVISYLDWIAGKPAQVTHDLGSSDLRSSNPSYTRVTPAVLSGLDDPPEDVTLESQIAAAYGVEPERVLLTAGASHANFLAVATTVSADGTPEEAADETARDQRILVEKPGYEPLVAMPTALDIQTDRFLRTDETDFQLDPARVEAALTEETDLAIVTNRHNPSGVLSSRESLADVARLCGEFDARLLVDEVYGSFVQDAVGDAAFGGVTAAGLEHTVVTGSVTKFFGLGELRVGWLIADEPFIERARHICQYVPAVAGPSVALARRAFHNAETLADQAHARLATNHAQLSSFVADRPDLRGTIQPGCTYGLLQHEALDGDELAEAAWEADILIVPGRFFGVPEGFRLAASRAPEDVEVGLSAFGSLLDDL